MKGNIFTLLVSIVTLSCNTHNKVKSENEILKEFKVVHFQLKDSLGEITISIPKRYDTFVQWDAWSDCNGCGKERYRYQLKKNPLDTFDMLLFKDFESKDSIDYLTIEHPDHGFILNRNYNYPENSANSLRKSIKENNKQRNSEDKSVAIEDTIMKINSRYFVVFVYSWFDSSTQQFNKQLNAYTLIGDNLEIKYKLVTKKNDEINKSFLENAKASLKTIKIATAYNKKLALVVAD